MTHLRPLRRHWLISLTAIAVLAVGIGVSGAMFSVLDALYLRPLPYPDAGQLVVVELPRNAGDIMGMATARAAETWRKQSRSFVALAGTTEKFGALDAGARTGLSNQVEAGDNLFTTLWVRPWLGRGLTAADATAHAGVAVLSYPLWQDLFQSRHDILGRPFRFNGAELTVVGVMPKGFTYPLGDPDFWTPRAPDTAAGTDEDADVRVLGRLRAGVTPAAAQAELTAIHSRIKATDAKRVVVQRYRDTFTGPLRTAVGAVAGAVGLVWLIACAAAAGLLLTRLTQRRGELAVRAALGANRRQLAAPLLREGLALGLAAGIVGAGLCALMLASLRHFLRSRLPAGLPIEFSWGVWGGLAALTLITALAAAAIPALLATRVSVAKDLRVGAAASASRAHTRLRDALVVTEIALALVLLAGAGLLLRTLSTLRSVPLGFRTDHILTMQLLIPPGTFAHRDMVQGFDRPLLERLRALPGVTGATITSVVPLERGFTMNGRFVFLDRRRGLPEAEQPQGSLRFASAGYAKVFGIPLERGRFFDASTDTPTSPLVVVVNHTFAAKYFPGQNPIGERFGVDRPATIVGVLADTHELKVASPPVPVMYFALSQLSPSQLFYGVATNFADVAVRTSGPPAQLASATRAALHALEPALALQEVVTMDQVVEDAMGDQIFAARLLGSFAAAALLIALVGLYGLLAFAFEQRRRELGIRHALGAGRRRIYTLVLGRAAVLLGAGLAAGLAISLLAAHALAAYLYNVPARDPLTLLAAALILATTGLGAAWLPARRAAAVPPTEALRAE